jgi:hypothetical protein
VEDSAMRMSRHMKTTTLASKFLRAIAIAAHIDIAASIMIAVMLLSWMAWH